jgi:hypothetical protein
MLPRVSRWHNYERTGHEASSTPSHFALRTCARLDDQSLVGGLGVEDQRNVFRQVPMLFPVVFFLGGGGGAQRTSAYLNWERVMKWNIIFQIPLAQQIMTSQGNVHSMSMWLHEVVVRSWMLSCSFPCTDTTLLALCYSNVLQPPPPQKDRFQGVRLKHFCTMVSNICNRCKIQFTEQHVLCEFYICRVAEYTLLSKLNFTSGTHFIDPDDDPFRAETCWCES